MTSFCSDPFDALQVASEVLGLPLQGRGPRDIDERAGTAGRDASPADEGVTSPSSRPCLYLAADKDDET